MLKRACPSWVCFARTQYVNELGGAGNPNRLPYASGEALGVNSIWMNDEANIYVVIKQTTNNVNYFFENLCTPHKHWEKKF